MIIINPSLQHVPKRFIIQSLEKESTVRLRQMSIARTGNNKLRKNSFQLVSFDYSQLELRILVHLSNDNKLKTRLINDTGFFMSFAADLLKRPFAPEIRMNINEAEEFIENFYTTFPIMTQFIDDIILISITNDVSYLYLLSSLKQFVVIYLKNPIVI
ncbi:unnamed protein product [Rotaria sordida]|nr:unnamed protein product [Rotaria sordida]